jgi:hypothetical protein
MLYSRNLHVKEIKINENKMPGMTIKLFMHFSIANNTLCNGVEILPPW